MKKNMGEKVTPKAANFEVYDAPPRALLKNEPDDKIALLTDRHDN